MFCPKCGTKNIEGVSFCRSCGVDISLVPQALTGHLPAAAENGIENLRNSKRRGKDEAPSIGKAIENFVLGVGFIFVALSVWKFMPGGFVWWFWMLIPAFALMGSGLSQFVRVKEAEKRNRLASPERAASTPQLATPPSSATFGAGELTPPGRDTAEIPMPPLSVTESTTRHLQVAANAPPDKYER